MPGSFFDFKLFRLQRRIWSITFIIELSFKLKLIVKRVKLEEIDARCNMIYSKAKYL